MSLVIDICAIATGDPARNEYASCHLVVEDSELRTANPEAIAGELDVASKRIQSEGFRQQASGISKLPET